MRFPDIPLMKRVFDLAKNRGLDVKLIPYINQMIDPPNTWLLFNGSRVNNQAPSVTDDPFNVSSYVADPSLRTPEGVSRRLSELFQPFRDLFRHLPGQKPNIATAMELLAKKTNRFSVRSYMFKNNMDVTAINWCETLDRPTGWYDQALTGGTLLGNLTRCIVVTHVITAIIESLALDWPTAPLPCPEQKTDQDASWFCFECVSVISADEFITLTHFVSQWRIFNALSGNVRLSLKEGARRGPIRKPGHCSLP